MTVVTYTVPESHLSTRFSCEVNDVAVDTAGVARAAEYAVADYWLTGASPEMSWLQVAGDETVQVKVSLNSGPITSAVIYPKWKNVQRTIVAGELIVTLPASTHAWVFVNGDQGQPIFLFSDPVIDDPVEGGPGVVVYDGSQTEVGEDETLWFQPGTHDIPQNFVINDGGTFHASGGAWISGNVKVQNKINLALRGHGVLSGEFSSPEAVRLLPTTAEKAAFSMINGYDPSIYPQGNVVEGITIVNPPFISQYLGINDLIATKVISPWYANCDGLSPAQFDNSEAAICSRCFIWSFDDALQMNEYAGNIAVSDCIVASGAAGSLHFGYQPWPSAGTIALTDITLVDVQAWFGANMLAANPPGESGILIQAWTDGTTGQESWVIADVEIDGLHVEGTKGKAMLFSLGNREYPWGTSADQVGQVKNWTISDLTVETEPIVRSRLISLDATNTPHDLTFHDITIAGVEVNESNWDTYVDQDSFAYNITLDQLPVVVSIEVTPATATVSIGTNRQFTATATYDDDSTADITETVQWSTSDLDALSISNSVGSEGLATALAAGTITVQALDVDSSVSGTATVTVPASGVAGSAPFNVEDGSEVEDANAYCTVEFADSYHLAYGNPSDWSTASTAEKEDAIRAATRAADETYCLRWHGYRITSTQVLDWPRSYVVDVSGIGYVPSDTMPLALQRWTARYALLHLQGETISPETQSGADIQSETLSGAGFTKSTTYAGSKPATKKFPALDRMLVGAGLISPASGWGTVGQ